MPAAIAVPAILGAAGVGAQVYGAKKASDASKQAAQIQTQAIDQAQAFNQRAYNDQKAAVQPYVDFGQNSLAALQRRYGGGAPMINRFAPTGMDTSGQASYQPLPDLSQGGRAGSPQSNLSPFSLAGLQQMGMSRQAMGGPMPIGPQAGPSLQPLTPPRPDASAPMAPATVRLRAPDGEVREIPAHLADAYLARGAMRVA